MQHEDLVRQLLNAAGRGDTALVVELLNSGLDINSGDSFGTTALMWAVQGCHLETIRALLDLGADLSVEKRFGHTAIALAVAIAGHPGKPRFLSQPDPRPLEQLLRAGGRLRLREAVLMNDVGLARARLEAGDDVDTGRGTYHGPMIKVAAELGYLDVVDLLIEFGANLEETDDLGQRALLSAARDGRVEAVRHLLDAGAEIDAVDWTHQSALSNAAIEDHHELVDLLLGRGARRGIVDALALRDIALFTTLLDEKIRAKTDEGGPADEPTAPYDVDGLSDGRHRLAMVAARRGDLEFVGLLLDRGAQHFQEWCDDHSLLAEAARHGYLELSRFLIDRGADLHTTGKDRLTPLGWATREGHEVVVELLRLAGAER